MNQLEIIPLRCIYRLQRNRKITSATFHTVDGKLIDESIEKEPTVGKKNLNPQMMDTGPEKMITVPDGVDAETLMKVLGNPEMVALLSSLAKSLES